MTTPPPDLKPACNFCGSVDFVGQANREGEKCASCGSLRRHRVALEIYDRTGLRKQSDGLASMKRLLHINPEPLLRREISKVLGAGYVAVEFGGVRVASRSLLLKGTDLLSLFPDEYFDYIVHNHWLNQVTTPPEKVVTELHRILRPWGYHIFSVPGPDLVNATISAEDLAPEVRLQKFGSDKTLRHLGIDFIDFLKAEPGGRFTTDNLSAEDRAKINVPPRSNRFLIWRRGRAGLTAPVAAPPAHAELSEALR